MCSAAFLAGLLHPEAPAFVTAEDLDGPHREAIARWQARGFIGREPGRHPHPSCSLCGEGTPYRVAGRLLCSTCRSTLDDRTLLAWPVHREAFLHALAGHLGLSDGTRGICDDLWELGSGKVDGSVVVCFVHLGGSLSEPARDHLSRYRRTLVLSAAPVAGLGAPGRWVPLAEVLDTDGTLMATGLPDLLFERGPVRFDRDTGVLRVGRTVAGEVPVGSREWAFLGYLAEQPDQFVPYRDLKREVLRRTGGSGGAEEATFCQKLKSRIKERFVPGIDRLVATTNKADGYRLRAEGEL